MRHLSLLVAAALITACGTSSSPSQGGGTGSGGSGADGGGGGGGPDGGGGGGGPDGGGGGGGPDGGATSFRLDVSTSGSGTVRSSPPGIDCGGACSARFDQGARVSLSAAPADDSTFAGWSGACSGAGDCTVTMTSDLAVAATFTKKPPPDECAGIAATDPGAPVVFRATVGRPERSYCLPGTSNGAGFLALHTSNSETSSERIWFVRSDGAPSHSWDGLIPQITYELDGFFAIDVTNRLSGTGYKLLRFARDGELLETIESGSQGVALGANDPLGGIFVNHSRTQQGGDVSSFDDAGRLRFQVPVPYLPTFIVDRLGNALTLSFADMANNHDLIGQWIDHDGKAGPKFQALNGLPDSWRIALYARVGGGVFVHVSTLANGGADVTKREWVRQFDSLATTGSAPPTWLTSRPDTKIHMARNGTAYAMLSLANMSESPDCAQRLEIVSASGKSCGTATFFVAPGACRSGSLDVGYDGTVIQQLPREKETTDSSGNATCTWRFWPGYAH
jgi:hypothetical protein